MTMTAAAAICAGAASAEEVQVFNWSVYIDDELLTKFKEETCIKLIYDVFDSNEVLETKLLAGGTGYDVVVPTGSFLQRQIQAGVFQKLDTRKLSNIGNLWGTTGIGVNVGKLTEILGEDAPIDSLSLVFDPANMEKLSACGVHFLDAPDEMIPAALTYLGEDPNSHDKDVIGKVEAMFPVIGPYVQKFHSSEYINALANGDTCVAVGWSAGRVTFCRRGTARTRPILVSRSPITPRPKPRTSS